MPELPGKSTPERSKATTDSARPPAGAPSPGRDRTHNPEWWVVPHFGYLLVWWVVIIGYYVVFSSIPGREHKGLVDPEMISDGWYAILTSGLVGAFYATRFRLLWFLLSMVLALLILLLMLLGLGSLKNLMNP
jgi:amino acid transporter